MKRIFISILFITVLFPFFSYAHVTKVEGNMAVLMHIDPDDEAVAKIDSNLFFLFNDSTKKFSLPECDCLATLFLNGKKISESKILTSSVPVMFPKKAVYILEVTGSPIDGKSFDSFKVSIDIRVEKEAESSIIKLFKDYAFPIVLSIIIFLLGFILVRIRKNINNK